MRSLNRRMDDIEQRLGIPLAKVCEKHEMWLEEFIELLRTIGGVDYDKLEEEFKAHVKALPYPLVDMASYAGTAMRFLENKYPDIHSKVLHNLRVMYEEPCNEQI